jgi:hypothetical protein
MKPICRPAHTSDEFRIIQVIFLRKKAVFRNLIILKFTYFQLVLPKLRFGYRIHYMSKTFEAIYKLSAEEG